VPRTTAWEPISPPPLRERRPGSLPAYLSNGVVGLRAGVVPQLRCVAILNGFVGVDPDSGAEAFARAPYPVAGDIELDGLSLERAPEAARLREQRYDFATGELHSSFVFDAGGARAEVEVLTFCSRTMPTLVLQETVVRVDRACDLALAGGVDQLGIPGSLVARNTRTRGSTEDPVDGSLRWESHGSIGTCGAAYMTELTGADADPTTSKNELEPLQTRYAFRARKGRRYRLRQIAGLVPSTMHVQPDLQAVRLVHGGALRGFDVLRRQHREEGREVWEARPILLGAPARWQALADAAFFYLHTSVHPSSTASMSLFGLAYWPDYHYYRGHVMWDIDTFAVPSLVLTHPDAARTLLEYRARMLPAARDNAAMNGYRGAQYPWESGHRTGEEAAPGEGAAAAHEHHVSLDVAFAFSQFLHATHDWEWGREHAWAVLRDVAEWAESRGQRTPRGFEIHGVNGIAERATTVDNNAFVNMAASVAFREAAALAQPLGHEPRSRWAELAQSVYVPIRDGVIRNHDRYRSNEEKGETPEAAAGLFPLTYDVEPDVERATFAFYLDLADRYVGSPMLSALLGVYAARIGDRARALELFERGYADFVVDPFSITTEYARDAFPEQVVAGPFTANIGGFLVSLLYGLTGLRIDDAEPEAWCRRPVTMPAGWDGIEVERIWARGAPARLQALHGAARGSLMPAT
jgi:trehalose/maltose hydrolase-like predicted phosphorylase